jgi:hypothetical protein
MTIRAVASETVLCVHPENPRYFLFRGRPRVLICATEHYGSVLNRAFDFERYLDEAADKKQTLTRLFLLFRELQTARNPFAHNLRFRADLSRGREAAGWLCWRDE